MEQIVVFLISGEIMNLNRIEEDAIVGGEFQAKNFISKIVIPKGVKKIGAKAFKDCENLEEITFPDGITEICPSAFENCKKLKKVILPNSVNLLGENLFKGCTGLGEVSLPSKIDIIPEGCFLDCRSLKKIRIPETVIAIQSCAFQGTGLKEIHFPDSLVRIGTNTFAGSNIAKVTGNTKNINFVGQSAFELTPISLKVDEDGIFRIDDIILYAKTAPKQMKFEDCLFASGCFCGNKTTKELLLINCRGINPCAFAESGVEIVQVTGSWFVVSMNAFEKCKIKQLELDAGNIVLTSYAFKNAEIESLFMWANTINFNLDFARDAHIKSFALKCNLDSITYDEDTFSNAIIDEISFVGGDDAEMYNIPNNEELKNILDSVYKKEGA